MTTDNSVENFLAASTRQYPPSTFASASEPQPGNINASQSPASPRSLEYLTAGDTAYPCYYLDFTKPSTVISDVRPVIVAAIGVKKDADLDLLRTYLRGGTVALLTSDGRTITANRVKLESYKDIGHEFGFPPNADGSTLALVRMSCDSRDYRGS
jgi:hypothetical protein